jgi:hypothetical protein
MSVEISESRSEPAPESTVPAVLLVFTWNVHKNPAALELACRHLKDKGDFVAVFQELPDDYVSLTQATGMHGLKVLSRTILTEDMRPVPPKIVMISNDDIEIDVYGNNVEYHPEFDDKRRLEGFTIRSPRWQKLQVMGVHGWDQISHPSQVRAPWGTIMRDVLDKFWNEGPLVFMGDFNANPWSAEITSREYLCALRKKDFPLKGETYKRAGREKIVHPLYNPMWQVLPDRETGAHGTISHVDDWDLRWHCFDQIILSQDLVEDSHPPEVLTSLHGMSLLDDNRAPMQQEKMYRWSQHLPVQMKIEIGKVESCKI